MPGSLRATRVDSLTVQELIGIIARPDSWVSTRLRLVVEPPARRAEVPPAARVLFGCGAPRASSSIPRVLENR
jgi:hypothetical protein